eukprot:CAMPEP_0185767940 /NCGR_PEP_ID=MMETSP1174-20130828/45921_1 /TAXON_ID=35687 /ORGANISM="Dictyocha speculum, Strain CCMP1381" /LENGTH=105 /DNA_ID=CAMNT_0028452347 /DNA_START=31 /DNA_END=348 /DNA_ORIENTATION=-
MAATDSGGASTKGVGDDKTVCDMDEHGEMKVDALKFAAQAYGQEGGGHTEENQVSKFIKEKFDFKYGPTWHCIVGTDFRAQVTHESKHFIFFYSGKTAICLYKTG